MARVACPACGKSSDVNQLHKDIRDLLGRLKGVQARHPDNESITSQVNLLERTQHHFGIIYRQRLALQQKFVRRGRRRKCELCQDTRSIDL